MVNNYHRRDHADVIKDRAQPMADPFSCLAAIGLSVAYIGKWERYDQHMPHNSEPWNDGFGVAEIHLDGTWRLFQFSKPLFQVTVLGVPLLHEALHWPYDPECPC